MLIKVLTFVAFIALYLGVLAVVGKVAPKAYRRVLSWEGAVATTALGVLFGLALTVFLFLLARFFNVWLTAALLVSPLVGLALGMLLKALLGTAEGDVEALWESVAVAVTSPATTTVAMVLPTVILFGYPLAAGIVYFTSPVPSPDATLWILRLTLLGLVIGMQVGAYISGWRLLASEALDDGVRTRALIERAVALPQVALVLALIFWTFSVVQEGATMSTRGVFASFSPAFVGGFVVFFALTSLLPFLVGSAKAGRWRQRLYETRRELLAQVLDALSVPHPKAKFDAVENAQIAIEGRIEELRQDRFMQSFEALDKGQIDLERVPSARRGLSALLLETSAAFRKQDSRFQQLDWLVTLREQLQTAAADVGARRSEATVAKASERWTSYFESKGREVERTVPAERRSRLAVVGSSLLGSLGLGQLLVEGAKLVMMNLIRDLPT